MDKQGAEKILFVWAYAILFLVAAGIVYMVFSFYGKPYDIRELEADALADRVSSCFSSGGYIIENWNGINQENFLETCNINLNVEDSCGWKDNQYYLEISINDFGSERQLNKFSSGEPNLKLNCEIKGKNFPICLERSMYSIDKNGNQYKINILSVVRKTEKNAESNC